MLLAVLTAWVLLSAVTASGCAVVLRGGLHEDARRGYLADPSKRGRIPSRTTPFRVAESQE